MKVGDKVQMNGKYDDMPNDGKVYTISYTGLISGERVYWIKGKSGGFAYDGFRLAPKGVKG